jgi:hypothetical protein
MRGLTLLLACLPLSAACAAPELDALLARIARPAPARTAFVEWRESALLAEPQRVAGELEYRGPAALSRRVDSPWRETTVVADGQVTVEREGERSRRFALRRAPELRVLLAGFGALLGGDRAGLARDFEIALETEGAAWRITLVPRDAAVRKHLATLAIDGRDDAPLCFLSTEADGDRSLMRVGAAVDWDDAADSDLVARVARCRAGD